MPTAGHAPQPPPLFGLHSVATALPNMHTFSSAGVVPAHHQMHFAPGYPTSLPKPPVISLAPPRPPAPAPLQQASKTRLTASFLPTLS